MVLFEIVSAAFVMFTMSLVISGVIELFPRLEPEPTLPPPPATPLFDRHMLPARYNHTPPPYQPPRQGTVLGIIIIYGTVWIVKQVVENALPPETFLPKPTPAPDNN